MKKLISNLNDAAAFKLMALYGTALTIWLFALYSLTGALVTNDTQAHMLYWSNAAQLVFCPLSIYVGNKIMADQKKIHAKHDANAAQIAAIHTHIDDNHAELKGLIEGQ